MAWWLTPAKVLIAAPGMRCVGGVEHLGVVEGGIERGGGVGDQLGESKDTQQPLLVAHHDDGAGRDAELADGSGHGGCLLLDAGRQCSATHFGMCCRRSVAVSV